MITTNSVDNPLLKVENLKMHFSLTKLFSLKSHATVKAVDGVSFSLQKGKTFGLVGESGCGKTTTGKCILRVHKPTSGSIFYKGLDIAHMTASQIKPFRREIQLIFQDPSGSLDPRQSIFSILREAIVAGGERYSHKEIKNMVSELLLTVELDPEMSDRYPHEMSGGQRQRLGIARALACKPELIVCDEPVSALDVSIQSQIINLFKELQEKLGLTYLFIAHDLAVVRYVADVIAVMYLGKIVEMMEASELYLHPMHPYTIALLSAVPITDYYIEQTRKRIILQGEVPSPINAPSGCPFHPRCTYATEICKQSMPDLNDVGNGHLVSCHNLAKVVH